VNPEGIG